MTGRIYQINVKTQTPGEAGLPKSPVESAKVLQHGLEGDFNRYRHERQHDDPDAALLLIPLETIQEINEEGWRVKPGDLGENITTTGISYEMFGPGTVFKLGEAEIQISRRCDPCSNLYRLPYVGEKKGPAFLKVMMGRRGWHARVVREGRIRKGDPIESPGQQ